MVARSSAIRRSALAAAAALAVALGLAAPAAADVTSTFDAGLDGWFVVGDAAASAAHDPAGHATVSDAAGGGVLYWRAPEKFLGDQRAAFRGSLSFDVRVSAAQDDGDYDVALGGLVRTLPAPVPGQWTHYEVPLDAGWRHPDGYPVHEESVRSVLGSLTQLWIRADHAPGADVAELDNVVMRYGPQADLSVKANVVDADVEVGELVTFRPEIANAGPDPATDVRLDVRLPEQLELVGYGDGCSVIEGCRVASLAPGEKRSFEVVARATRKGAIFVTEIGVHSATFDPDLGDAVDRVPHTLGTPDTSYRLFGAVEQKTADGREPFLLNLVVTNNGPHQGPGSELHVTLSDAVELVSAPAGCATAGDPRRLRCDVGEISRNHGPVMYGFSVRGLRVAPDAESRAEIVVKGNDANPDDHVVVLRHPLHSLMGVPAPPVPLPPQVTPPPAHDTVPPVARLSAFAARKGITVKLTSGEDATARVTARAPRVGRLGSIEAALRAGEPRKLTLRLGRKARARLFKARRTVTVTVRAVLTDASGNVTTTERRLKLRR